MLAATNASYQAPRSNSIGEYDHVKIYRRLYRRLFYQPDSPLSDGFPDRDRQAADAHWHGNTPGMRRGVVLRRFYESLERAFGRWRQWPVSYHAFIVQEYRHKR